MNQTYRSQIEPNLVFPDVLPTVRYHWFIQAKRRTRWFFTEIYRWLAYQDWGIGSESKRQKMPSINKRTMPDFSFQKRGHYTVIFKVAFSTFRFKFGATLRRQAERRDSGTRQKASNLAQPIS